MKKVVYGFIVIFAAVFLWWYFFVDMSRLPDGELLTALVSPGHEYTVNLYLCGGGATTAYSIRGEVVSGGKVRNIYWQYKEDSGVLYWESDTVVNINGISLDVRKDAYDWRRQMKARTA